MAKLTLTDITSLANAGSAKTTLNNNFAAIETAIENTLSRNGASPNAMAAQLDMGNNRILNVADAVSDADAINRRTMRDYITEYTGQIAQTIIEGSGHTQVFIATSGQTVFPLSGNPGNVQNMFVYDQGVFQIPDTDFVLSGTNLVFTTGRVVGNQIVVRWVTLAPTTSEINSLNYPTLLNSAAEAEGPRVAYWKDNHDIVHLQGHIRATAPNAAFMQLPVGYRPPTFMTFAVPRLFDEGVGAGSEMVVLVVQPTGLVMVSGNGVFGESAYFPLNGIYFKI